MAITQISKIQVRRGLQENLPQLSGGELGWSLDLRKLYMGNGTIAEGAPTLGNTEILTEFSNVLNLSDAYTFAGAEASYIVQTGQSLVAPVARSLQNKLDDIANFKDFGGVGDGVTNELPAFNRAISQLYKDTLQQTEYRLGEARIRRTLYIPAGRYLLVGSLATDFIKLLPYVKLKGDGKNATIIIQRNLLAPCTLMSADSKGQTGAALGTNLAVMPEYMEVEDLTLINDNPGHVVQLDSITSVAFKSVRMQGSKPTLDTAPIEGLLGPAACVNLNSQQTVSGSANIYFTDCDFINNEYAMYADNSVANVVIRGGLFTHLYRGISLGMTRTAGFTPYAVKISYAMFDAIAQEAIVTSSVGSSPAAPTGVSDGVANIVSAFNTYRDVGSNLTNNGTIASNVIHYGGDNSYSIGDTFDRVYNAVIPAVVLTGVASFATFANGQIQIGRQVSVGGRTATLAAGTTTNTLAVIVGVGNTATTVEYKITRDLNTRVGVMKIAPAGTSVVYDDEYVESSDTGVTLIPFLTAGGVIELLYTMPTTGSVATLTAASRTLI